MITKDTSIITRVIAVWGWHLLAFMFFLKSLGFMIVREYQWFGGLIGVFVICELVAVTKKWKLEKDTKGEEHE